MRRRGFGIFGLTLAAGAVLVTAPLLPPSALAASPTEEMQAEIARLKDQMIDVEDMLDEFDERVGANERHTVSDRLTFNVDLRNELTSLHYQDVRVMPEFAQAMLQNWAFDELVQPLTQEFPKMLAGNNMTVSDMSMMLFGDTTHTIAEILPLLGMPADGQTFDLNFMQTYAQELGAMMPAMLQGGFITLADPMGTPDNPADDVPVIQTTSLGGQNVFFGRKFGPQELAMYQGMFRMITPEKKDADNDVLWTVRARFDMRADPTPHVTFGGRLSANKLYGDSTGVQWFNGSFDTMAMDGNIHQKSSDSTIRLERGFITYRDDLGDVHWHFSIGRRPALGGGPWEVSTDGVLGASPLVHAINWQFDGASLGFDLAKVTGVEGFNFKFCWGLGFESGLAGGNSYSSDPDNEVDDVNFLGYIFRPYDDGKTKISHMYARAFDVSDGFTGMVAVPFTITALDKNSDGNFDEYYLDANYGGWISRFEPSTNMGDIDLFTLLLQTNIKGFDMFIDLAANISHPRADSRSRSAMMQFMGWDGLLNSYDPNNPNGLNESHEGYSVWAGIKAPIPWTKGSLGFEWNWGSQYWFGYNESEDTLGANKLATRGNVYEVYYHQPIIGKTFLATIGYQYFDHEYTNSGNPLGAPKKIEEATALDSVMPVVDTMWSAYVNLNYRW